MALPELRGLYAITPDALPAADLMAAVDAALAGGVRWLQYRDKTRGAAERRGLAERLLTLCRARGAALLINDDLELALAVGADGVHLGADDGDLAIARARLGSQRILGASCYADGQRAARAAAAGADYLAFGAVYPSPTKPQAVVAPLSLLAAARRQYGKPVAAIGGITLANAAPVIAAGADLVAVISDLFQAPDICRRAHDYQQLFSGEQS
jgi:thiamine-phosphate pyrophosphorylase